MQLTKNFTDRECGCPCGCGGHMHMQAVMKLQELRDKVGFPLSITSGFRCVAHNKKVGGAVNSRHLQGDAVDISRSTLSGAQYIKLIMTAASMGYTGFGFHPMFLHLDTRPGELVAWFYPN